MSYTDDFLSALGEERKKKEKKNGSSSVTQTSSKSSGDSFTDEFLSELQNLQSDIKEIDSSFLYNKGLFRDEEDIAPVKEGDNSSLEFFEAGSFEDGYQFGDVSKAILGTAGDAVTGVAKGFFGFAEGIADTLGYGIYHLRRAFGESEDTLAEYKSNIASSTADWVFGGAEEFLDDYSLLGHTSNSIMEGVGQAVAMIGTSGYLGGAAGLGAKGGSLASSGVLGVSSFGSGMSEAYSGGATDEEAATYGVASAATEILTEKLFGGLGKGVDMVGFNKGALPLDDMAAKAVSKFCKSQTGKNVAEYAVKGGFEGLEEGIAGYLQAHAKKGTFKSEEDFAKILEDENLFEQFIVGAFVSGAVQSGDVHIANKTGRDFVSGNTQNEQAVIDKELENRIAEAEKDGNKLSRRDKNKIYDEVVRDMERGYISTDTIEEVLGGDSYKSYKDTVAREDAINKEYEELKNKQGATLEEQARFKEVRREYYRNQANSQRDQLKTKLGEDVFKRVQNDRLIESYLEKNRVYDDFQADLTKYKGTKHEDAANKTIENAIKAGANNTNRVHDIVDMAADLSSETGYVYDFKDGEQIKNDFIERKTKEIAKLEAIENRTVAQNEKIAKLKDLVAKVKSGEVKVNGNVDSNGIVLNLGSEKPLNRIIGHEITHTVEKAKHYEKLRDSLFDYAKSKGVDIDAELEMKALEYEGVEGTTAEAELVADLVGDYLFTDGDFVKHLSTKNRNLAQRIYDEIKYLITKATQGSKEERELLKVKHEFEKAFRETGQNRKAIEAGDADTKHSFSGATAKTADNSQLLRAKKMLDEGIDSETVRQETGWYKGYDGQWRFEIDDSELEYYPNGRYDSPDVSRYRELSEKVSKREETEVEFEEFRSLYKSLEDWERSPYRLTDYINHKNLFDAYPQLKDVRLKLYGSKDIEALGFDGKSTGGYYDSGTNTIVLNKEWNNTEEKAKQTLIHEIQHAIQKIEGFASGASVEYWQNKRKDIADTIKGAKENLDLWLDDIGYSDFVKSSMQEVAKKEKTLDQHWKDCKEFKAKSKYSEQIAACEAEVAEYQRIYDEVTNGMTAYEQYRNTAGEIEARDAENRLNLTAEQRKSNRPDIDNENVVFANSNNGFSYIGDTKDGRRVYRSDFGDDVSEADRIAEFKNRIATIFNLGAVELKTDVKKIRVKGDKFTEQKNLFGDKMAQPGEMEAKVNSLYDLADILATSKYDPSATEKEPSYANPALKPKNKAHKDVKYWYKFRNEIVFDGVPYTVTFSIRDKGSEQYQYLIDFKENKTPGLSNTAVNSLLRANQASYEDNIAPIPENVKTQYSLSDNTYLDAVNRGDTETAQKMVDEAAKNAGYTVKAYHGTYNFGRTVFDVYDTLFVTDSEYTARNFSGGSGRRLVSSKTLDPDNAPIEQVVDYVVHNTAWGDLEPATVEQVDPLLDRFTYTTAEIKKYGISQEQVERGKQWANQLRKVRSEIESGIPYWTGYNVSGIGVPNSRLADEAWVRNIAREALARKGNHGGSYELCVNLGNTVVVDGGGAYYASLPVPSELRRYARPREIDGATTDQIVRMAYDAGYDSVTFKDIREGGDYGDAGVSTVYAVFNPTERVKSADVVTKDDNGNVIPLSQRFNTENDDIRYSLSDSNGNQLSNEQQEFFKDSKARDENGSLKVVYHGTRNADFTVFKRNATYFTDNKEMADSYSPNGDMYEGYVNITKPYEIDANGEKWSRIPIDDATRKFLQEYGSSVFKEDGKWRTSPADIVAAIEEAVDNGDMDYDGIIIRNIDDTGSYYKGKDSHLATDYIVFNSNQFKNADNKAPTSDPDIRYSLSDSNGRELSPAVQNRFSKSKVVDENGNLKAVYHGTASGEFSIFDKSKGNVEGDFGSGFYFTDNEYDVSNNYEGGGADFEHKVARLAERIEQEEDIDYAEAEARARDELYKGSHKFEVYLNIENPAIVGETTLLDPESYFEEYDREDYDSEEDYEGDVEQLITDEIDNILWEVEKNIDVYSTDGLAEVLWNAVNEGGIDIEQLKANINDLYLEDSEGNLVGNEVTRQIIESLGYDGIIDPTVSSKWNMDMEEGTTHYIVFKPNQIKSITNENPTDNPDIHLSLSNKGKQFAPIGRNDFFGKDFRKQSADDIAPVREDVNPSVENVEAVGENVTDEHPVAETADVESLAGDRDSFVSKRSMELYKEITSLKKGVRASKSLGYLLDHGHEWRSIKTALLNIRDNPNQVVNPNSAAESVAREMLGREYDDMVAELAEPSDVAESVRIKMQHIQTEIANNERLREQSNMDYDQEIADVQAEYDAKKNKNTIVANNLLRRIERLNRMKNTNDDRYAKRIGDLEARLEKMRQPTYKTAVQRKAKQNEYTNLMKNLVGDTTHWVDKKLGISYKVNTLRRNLRDVVRDANGNRDIAKADAIYDELQGKYNHNEAELKRESRRIKAVFAELKLNHTEDTYAHMLGEFRHNPDSKLTEEVVKEFYEKNKGKIDTTKVDKAIEEARKTFDDLIVRVNERLKEQGMKEIPYRQGYFPHFTNPKQGWLAKLFNWKTVDTEIPTSIAGLTETFNPERSWQGFSKQRKGDTTDYSLEQGLDTYIHGSLDWIYHIEDIQKRRALENYIRYIHSEEGVKARVDAINNSEELDADEAQRQIDAVYAEAKNPLNNFVTNLRAGTNTLANKKSENDRQIESDTNRKIYSVMTNLNNRINANMVVGSLSSALTNFIPITQSWMEVSPVYSLRGMKDTIKSTIRDDGIVSKSDFLTNRLLNEENLYQTTWDKISDKAAIMMEAIDSFTSQTVWRSKYLQNISEGMSETEAIKNADQFAENVIAGRSRGNQPTIFDAKNPFTKMFTAFQLEVNNQYGYFFKDAPQDSKNKTRLVKGYATAFVGAYVYNALYSSLVGRDAAFDPIGIIEDLLRDMGLFGEEEEEEPVDVALNLADNIVDELPFIGGLTGGGRIPISSAIPYGGDYKTLVSDIANGESNTKEWLKPIYYLVLPVGGGQIKKTNEGLGMFSDDHPVSGSYTESGNLRFPVEDNFGNRLQAGLFGQYASENARDYFDNGRSPLKEEQIQEYIDVDIPIRDYWEYREGLSEQKTVEDKFDYIAGLDLPVSKKNILINNIVDREEDVDLEGYEDFSSYDEFDFATKKPGKYAVAQAVGGYDAYSSYMDALGDIEADKDESGKSISGSRKEKVINYIESLDIDYGMKIILFKSMYDSKEDRNNYNADIVAYLDSRDDISYEEMVTILTELGMRVEGNNVYWD